MLKHCDVVNHGCAYRVINLCRIPCLKDVLISNYQYVTNMYVNVVIQFESNYGSKPPQAYIEKLTDFDNSPETLYYHD